MAPVKAAVNFECDTGSFHPLTLPHAASHHVHFVFWGRSFCRRNVNDSVISQRNTPGLSSADTQLIDRHMESIWLWSLCGTHAAGGPLRAAQQLSL